MHLRSFALAGMIALFSPTVTLVAQTLPPPRAMPTPYGPFAPLVLPPPAPVFMTPPKTIISVLPPVGKPMPVLPLAAAPFPPPGYRPSAYQVWQNYGLTYNGWLRPRVIQVTNGGYFLYNGAPYPYVYVFPGYHFGSVGPAGPAGP